MAEERPISASEIYESIVGGEGTARLGEAGLAAAKLRQLLESSTDELGSLARRTHEGWQGGAGAMAANQAWLLAMACGSDSHKVDLAAAAIVAQIDAFTTVHRTVLPVPPEPPPITTQGLAAYLSGGSDYQADLVAYRACAENNVRAFAQYHEASVANGASIPTEIAPLATSTAEVDRTDTAPLPPGRPFAATEPAPASADTPSPHVAHDAHGDTPRPPNPVPPEAISGGTDETPPMASGAAAADSASKATRVAPTPGEHSSIPTQQAAAGPHGAVGAGGASAGYGERALGGGDRFVAGTDKRVPVSGRRGDGRPEVPVGPPGGIRGASPAQPNGRPATGGQPGGNRGATGVPLGAAGPRRGEEDRERKRPTYLVDPDPDETFAGPHERTVPPVVGERPER